MTEVTRKELAKHSGYSVATLINKEKEGVIERLRPGKPIFNLEESLEKLSRPKLNQDLVYRKLQRDNERLRAEIVDLKGVIKEINKISREYK